MCVGNSRFLELCELVGSLLSTKQMVNLWDVSDAGMPVFVHTVDVTLLAIQGFPVWQSRHGAMDIVAVTIGSLLHDLTKATCRAHREYTHSWLMSNQPELAVREAMDALDGAQLAAGVAIDHLLAEHVSHIVASHHGPWGKIPPATPEAALVFRSDMFSAQNHRVAPVDANDVLPLLAEGSSKAKAARFLGVSSSVVRSRLLESCDAEGVGSIDDLLTIWLSRGRVRLGSDEKSARLARARWLMEEAKNAQRSIVDALMTVEGADT